MNIYAFSSYEDFFNRVISDNAAERGFKSRLASAMDVHPSYITRIGNGTASLTPDQASAMGDFLDLDVNEKEYFLWLVLRDRSSEKTMVELATEKLKSIKRDQNQLGKRLAAEKIDPSRVNEYYFNWIFSAVHMLLTLPGGKTTEQISKHFGITEKHVDSALAVLLNLELIKRCSGKRFMATKKNVHLDTQSWMAPLYHKSWRNFCQERINLGPNEDTHYTGVHTISKKDLEKLRQYVKEFLVDVDKTVRQSKEETLCLLSVDFMEF